MMNDLDLIKCPVCGNVKCFEFVSNIIEGLQHKIKHHCVMCGSYITKVINIKGK